MGKDCVHCNHWTISLLGLFGCIGGSFIFSWGKHVLSGLDGWLSVYKSLLSKVIFNFDSKGQPEPHL